MLGDKNIPLLVFFALVLGLISCDTKQSYSLPEGAIPIIYADYIHFTGSVEGKEGIFLFDTGAGNLYLDTLFYNEGNFVYKDLLKYQIEGLGNSYQDIIIINDTVKFNFSGYDYATSFVPVMNLKPVGGDIIDGLLGNEFFSNNVLEINYADEYIKIHETIDSIDISDYTKLPITPYDNSFLVPLKLKINEDVTLEGYFLVDAASPSSSLTTEIAVEADLDAKITKKIQFYNAYGGVGGETGGYDFIADSITIAMYCLKDVVFGYSTDTAGLLSESDYLGILGSNILDRFDLLIDYTNQELYFKPGKLFEEPFVFNRLGFGYVDRYETMKGWIITGLYRGSPAEKLGLRPDDKIIKVNSIPVQEIAYEDQANFFNKLKRVKLDVLRSGEVLSFKFKLQPLL